MSKTHKINEEMKKQKPGTPCRTQSGWPQSASVARQEGRQKKKRVMVGSRGTSASGISHDGLGQAQVHFRTLTLYTELERGEGPIELNLIHSHRSARLTPADSGVRELHVPGDRKKQWYQCLTQLPPAPCLVLEPTRLLIATISWVHEG